MIPHSVFTFRAKYQTKNPTNFQLYLIFRKKALTESKIKNISLFGNVRARAIMCFIVKLWEYHYNASFREHALFIENGFCWLSINYIYSWIENTLGCLIHNAYYGRSGGSSNSQIRILFRNSGNKKKKKSQTFLYIIKRATR